MVLQPSFRWLVIVLEETTKKKNKLKEMIRCHLFIHNWLLITKRATKGANLDKPTGDI